MRLINIETLALHEFDDVRIPPYYILSHRWEKDEITFQDVKKSRNRGHYGWSKVKNFCQFVKNHPIDDPRCERVVYIWIDTCCIDKRNSAELSEAINSMYQWYRKAVACYAYLNDVPAGGEDRVHEYMRRSEWFTRGWTLQELLAPVYTIFVDKDWTGVLGDGSALASLLSEITGIPEKLVNRDRSYKNVPRPNTGDFSIAQIMSWASKREYTKKEDVAYGLMGLFGVHMPLLYGEGGVKAFQRLQQEILKISCDESIFAWFCEDEKWLSGMLAPSPENFSHSGNIQRGTRGRWMIERPEFTFTNKGLKFEISTELQITWTHSKLSKPRLCLFLLNCHVPLDETDRPFPVFLKKNQDGSYGRFNACNCEWDLEVYAAEIYQQKSGGHGNKREVIYCPQRFQLEVGIEHLSAARYSDLSEYATMSLLDHDDWMLSERL